MKPRPRRVLKVSGIAVSAATTVVLAYVKAAAGQGCQIDRVSVTASGALATHKMIKVECVRISVAGTATGDGSVDATVTIPNTHYSSETTNTDGAKASTSGTWGSAPTVSDTIAPRYVHPINGYQFIPSEDEGGVAQAGMWGVRVTTGSSEGQTFDIEFVFTE